MKSTDDIYNMLVKEFGEEGLELKPDEVVAPFIVVAPGNIQQVAKYLRDEQELHFDYLMCLSGVHYEKEEQLAVTYHLNSTSLKHKVILKVVMAQDDARVPTVEQVWKTADWHEREAFDMFGIQFEGHPDHRRILCPDDWEGHPLRKDYKVQEFYRGMKVEY